MGEGARETLSTKTIQDIPVSVTKAGGLGNTVGDCVSAPVGYVVLETALSGPPELTGQFS